MFEARHAAVVAGLGLGEVIAFPTTASALVAINPSTILAETPGLAFVVGAVAGFAVVGAFAGISHLVSKADEQPTNANGRHFAGNVVVSAQPMEAEAAPVYVSRHMRVDAEPTMPAVGAHARTGRHFAVADDENKQLSLEARIPSPEITDYVNVAERFVNDERKEKSKAVRAKGVAAVLVERMDLQKGFPTIERGASQIELSETWWDDLEPVAPNVTATAVTDLPELTTREKRILARENAAKRRAAERISRSVAQVDQGMYPELRTADDLDDGEDLWMMAMTAMEDHMPQVVFSDNVGNADTIDEPDGLAANTNFLTFRARAQRPEFNDTASFIDYIVSDELARSSSDAVRRRSRSYLTLLEGGTQSTGRVGRHVRGTRELQASSTGKHFAQAAEA